MKWTPTNGKSYNHNHWRKIKYGQKDYFNNNVRETMKSGHGDKTEFNFYIFYASELKDNKVIC